MSTPETPNPELIPEILTNWQTLTEREPWRRLPSGDHVQQLGALLQPLLRAADGESDDRSCHEAYARLASEIGRRRRAQAVPREALFGDFHLLRQAVWVTLRERLPAEAASAAIMRIDVAISVCTRAALLGYHHTELGPEARWQALVAQVTRESPLWPRDDLTA